MVFSQVMVQIGVLQAITSNLGDDIQTLSALQFAPDAAIVSRDEIGNEQRDLTIIGNAWWMEGECYPRPDQHIIPISMHIAKKTRRNLCEWLRSIEPIGCRDLYTLRKLQRNKIKAYFSGCLTLTFPENKKQRTGGIVYTDMIPDHWKPKEGIFSEHILYNYGDLTSNQRLEQAQQTLDLYKNAELVITGRLHAALPCLAFGTPVLVNTDVWAKERFSGYEPYLNTNFQGFNPKNYQTQRPEKLIDLLKQRINQ